MGEENTVGKLLDTSFQDLRQDIREARAEQRQDLKELTVKVDTGFYQLTQVQTKIANDLDEHEKDDIKTTNALNLRLKGIEDARANTKWLTRVGISTGLLFLSDLVINHLPKWFK